MVAEVQKPYTMMGLKKQLVVSRLYEQVENLWWLPAMLTPAVMLVRAEVPMYLQVAGNELHSFAVDRSFRYFEQHWCSFAYQHG
jgi:hypothetical protein